MHPNAQRPPPLDTVRYRLTVVNRPIIHHHQGKAVWARVGKVVERQPYFFEYPSQRLPAGGFASAFPQASLHVLEWAW